MSSASPPTLSELVPRDQLGPKQKIIHFVRHAQGFHNVFPMGQRAMIHDPSCHDAKLTEHGIQQCDELQRKSSALRPELVVASPLTRTLQTAERCFGPQRKASGAKLLALELVRETVNYYCDGRRSLTVIAKDLGFEGVVDFSECTSDHDEIWAAYERKLGPHETHQGLRETADLHALHARAVAAVAWIGSRPEREIVVVSHAAFLHHLFGFGPAGENGDLAALPACFEYAAGSKVRGGATDLGMHMRSYFGNCEMKSVVCTWP